MVNLGIYQLAAWFVDVATVNALQQLVLMQSDLYTLCSGHTWDTTS